MREAHEEMISAQRCAEVRVLAEIINAIPAAARVAMSSPIMREVGSGVENDVRYFEQEGIVLLGGPDRPVESDDSRLVYGCEVLVLWVDGTLADITYTATCTGMDAGPDHIVGIAEGLSPLEAMNRWEFVDCLGGLRYRFAEHVDSERPKGAKRAGDRAKKLTRTRATRG